MASRRRNPSQRLAAQSVELAWAAPQVVAHRLTRMANAGSQPSARDRHEFARMGHEKVLAFAQSGMAFWMQMLRGPSSRAAGDAAARLLAAGLAPLHVTAVANARRLNGRSSRKMRRP
jgi:hypothetical protein